MSVRAKFVLVEANDTGFQSWKYVFEARYDQNIPEDQRFATATPSGRVEMHVTNPAVHAQFKVGQAYYFDVSSVPSTDPVIDPPVKQEESASQAPAAETPPASPSS